MALSPALYPNRSTSGGNRVHQPAQWSAAKREQITELGLAGTWPDFEEALDRLDAIAADRPTAPVQPKALLLDVAAEVAAGTVTMAEGAARLTEARRTEEADAFAVDLHRAALAQAARQAVDCLARRGDSIVTDTLAPAIAAIFEEWAEHAPRIPTDVQTVDEAMALPEKGRQSWLRLTDLLAQALSIWDLADELRGLDVLTTDRRLNVADGEYRWLHPERLPVAPRRFSPHPVLEATAALASGAGPTVLTAAQVRQSLAAADERARAEQEARRGRPRRTPTPEEAA